MFQRTEFCFLYNNASGNRSGNPAGDLLTRSNVVIIGGEAGSPTFSWFTFHPMKGPMVTQTFQDIIGHEPFHWRGLWF